GLCGRVRGRVPVPHLLVHRLVAITLGIPFTLTGRAGGCYKAGLSRRTENDQAAQSNPRGLDLHLRRPHGRGRLAGSGLRPVLRHVPDPEGTAPLRVVSARLATRHGPRGRRLLADQELRDSPPPPPARGPLDGPQGRAAPRAAHHRGRVLSPGRIRLPRGDGD